MSIKDDLRKILRDAHSARDEAEANGAFKPSARAREAARAAHYRILRDLGREAGAPPDEVDLLTSGGLRETDILAKVQRWSEGAWSSAGRSSGRKTWALLVGGKGSGKTTAAVWALLDGTRQLAGPRVYVASRYVARLSLKFAPDCAQLDALASARWLVLDDVGFLDGHDGHVAPAVQCLLADRFDRRARTIITSNLSPERLTRYLDDGDQDARFADRFRQVCTDLVTLQGSLRTQLGVRQ